MVVVVVVAWQGVQRIWQSSKPTSVGFGQVQPGVQLVSCAQSTIELVQRQRHGPPHGPAVVVVVGPGVVV